MKAGDWVVSKLGKNEAFRVAEVCSGKDNVVAIRPSVEVNTVKKWLIDKWGKMYDADDFKLYTGAISPLEAAEAAKDAVLDRYW